jgi:hypothetical protein
MDNKIVDIRIEGDLYVAGRTEDGEDYIAENFMVCVEFAYGEVYRHKTMWLGCKVHEADPEDDWYGIGFEDIREASRASAERLLARVTEHVGKGGTLNMDHWTFRRTSYGSRAYLDECAMMTPAQLAGENE